MARAELPASSPSTSKRWMEQGQAFWAHEERQGGLQNGRIRRTTAWKELAHPKTVHLADFLCGKQDASCSLQSVAPVVFLLMTITRIICYESTIISGQHSRLPRSRRPTPRPLSRTSGRHYPHFAAEQTEAQNDCINWQTSFLSAMACQMLWVIDYIHQVAITKYLDGGAEITEIWASWFWTLEAQDQGAGCLPFLVEAHFLACRGPPSPCMLTRQKASLAPRLFFLQGH